MGHKKDYIIVTHFNSEDFIEMVNNKLSQGYILVGGVSMAVYVQCNGDSNFRYAQAMCKE